MIKVVCGIVLAGLMGYSLYSYSDDSEVFFSDVSNAPNPNVLLLLDNSGSMNLPMMKINTVNISRLTVLKRTVETLLLNPELSNLYLGIMTYSDADQIKLIQPVVDIDQVDDTKEVHIPEAVNGVVRFNQP